MGVSGYRPTRVVPDQRPLNGRCCIVKEGCIPEDWNVWYCQPYGVWILQRYQIVGTCNESRGKDFWSQNSAAVPSVLWHCWVGGRKGIRPVKNWVVRCWCGYLSGARCRLAHAQLMPLPLTISCSSKIQIGFTFLVLAHPGSPGQRAVKQVCVCVCLHRMSLHIWSQENVACLK